MNNSPHHRSKILIELCKTRATECEQTLISRIAEKLQTSRPQVSQTMDTYRQTINEFRALQEDCNNLKALMRFKAKQKVDHFLPSDDNYCSLPTRAEWDEADARSLKAMRDQGPIAVVGNLITFEK